MAGEEIKQALYRRLRPKRFADFVNQELIVQTLRNALATGRLAHAYVFSGPKGTGKTTLARLLFQAANCLAPEKGEPCGHCSICKAAEEGKALDLIEIDAASHTGVENVRDIINKVHLAPSQARFKFYIIDEAHMLSRSAFNALLKTLEEPPAHVVFILATTEVYKLPATILSRCQRFDFRPFKEAEIVSYLEKVAAQEKYKVDKEGLGLIAAMASGSMRDALSLLEQVNLAAEGKMLTAETVTLVLGLAKEKSLLKLTEELAKGEMKEALKTLEALSQEGGDAGQLVHQWLNLWRRLLLVKLAKEEVLPDSNDKEAILVLAKKISLEKILSAVRGLIKAEEEMRFVSRPYLPLELFVVEQAEVFSSNPGVQKNPDPPSLPSETKKEQWQDFVGRINRRSPTLGGLLRLASPRFLEEEKVLELVFPHSFGVESCNRSPHKRMLLEEAGKFWPHLTELRSCQEEGGNGKLKTPEAEISLEEIHEVFNSSKD